MPFSQLPSWRVSLSLMIEGSRPTVYQARLAARGHETESNCYFRFHVHNWHAHTPASLVLFPVTSLEPWRTEAPLKFKVQPPLLWGEYLCCAWRGWGLNTPLNEQRFYFSDLLQTVYDWLTKQILLSQAWCVTSLPYCWNCNSCWCRGKSPHRSGSWVPVNQWLQG